jgi:hypothetical protein
MEKISLVNEISARDKVLGGLSFEMVQCASEGKFMAGLACLFILVEQALKSRMGKADGNFKKLILEAKKEKLINQAEFDILENMRETRNKLFHESHYGYLVEREGLLWQYSEEETKELLLKELLEDGLRLAYRFCTSS